jgi:uncharacterized membrane protein (UPF0182 family)
MKRLFLVLFVAALIIGCAKDIYIEPLSDLRGVYQGKYIVKTDGGASLEEYIIWTFSDTKFWSEIDTTKTQAKVFCDLTGVYKVGDVVTLSEVNTQGQQCNPYYVLSGDFSMRRPGDSVILEQYDADAGAHKYIRVEKTK